MENNLKFHETSAMTGLNVKEAFNEFVLCNYDLNKPSMITAGMSKSIAARRYSVFL
jgi:hypothetical protein